MKQWEYIQRSEKPDSFDMNHPIQDFLNVMGRQGWECFHMEIENPRLKNYEFFFKREKVHISKILDK